MGFQPAHETDQMAGSIHEKLRFLNPTVSCNERRRTYESPETLLSCVSSNQSH